jgi:hypothetical protein
MESLLSMTAQRAALLLSLLEIQIQNIRQKTGFVILACPSRQMKENYITSSTACVEITFINYSLILWRRNYFFNFSTSCI